MKKTTHRTLTLNRETLHGLDNNRLKRVAGGYYTHAPDIGVTVCACPEPANSHRGRYCY